MLPSGSKIPQDLVVAVRGWANRPRARQLDQHPPVSTHGLGYRGAKAEASGADGTPAFVESDIPPHGQLHLSQPRVYFGQQENPYAIVGGPPGRPGQELDYPVESASGQQNYTYNGTGGVPVGSLLNRFLYAVKFRELNILLSGAINSDSKILYDRPPLDRVAKAAPFLTLDANRTRWSRTGRLWVVTATTTDLYPYSERISLLQTTSTSQTPNGRLPGS